MGIEKLGMEGFNVDDGVSVPGKLGSEIKTFTGEVALSLKGETEEVNKTDKKSISKTEFIIPRVQPRMNITK